MVFVFHNGAAKSARMAPAPHALAQDLPYFDCPLQAKL
jgi:hypothetical protein